MTSHNTELSFATLRRNRSRLATQLPARIITLFGTANVVLADLSLTGAKLQLPDKCHFAGELKEKADAQLQWFEFEAFGSLKWVKLDRSQCEVGMRFEEPIQPAILLGTRDIYDQFCKAGGYTALVQQAAHKWVQGI